MRKLNLAGPLSGIVVCMLFAVPSYAQLATVTDGTCTVATQCNGQSGHGCNSTGFTVPSTATYKLTASIDGCSGSSTACFSCLSEAYIYETNSLALVACFHNSCGSSCTSQSTNVALSNGVNYTLFSCKIDCSNDDCSNCPTSCVARATVDLFP